FFQGADAVDQVSTDAPHHAADALIFQRLAHLPKALRCVHVNIKTPQRVQIENDAIGKIEMEHKPGIGLISAFIHPSTPPFPAGIWLLASWMPRCWTSC